MPDKYGNPIKAYERETQRALELPRRPPDEWDGKPVSTFPGPKIRAHPEQLALLTERARCTRCSALDPDDCQHDHEMRQGYGRKLRPRACLVEIQSDLPEGF